MVRVPTDQPPSHPGEVLLEEFLEPLEMSQSELAKRIEISFPRVNEIVNKKRPVTMDTAQRLARLFGTSPDFWLNLQLRWDLYAARHAKHSTIERIQPLNQAARESAELTAPTAGRTAEPAVQYGRPASQSAGKTLAAGRGRPARAKGPLKQAARKGERRRPTSRGGPQT